MVFYFEGKMYIASEYFYLRRMKLDYIVKNFVVYTGHIVKSRRL
jgi:hypothetical protein